MSLSTTTAMALLWASSVALNAAPYMRIQANVQGRSIGSSHAGSQVLDTGNVSPQTYQMPTLVVSRSDTVTSCSSNPTIQNCLISGSIDNELNMFLSPGAIKGSGSINGNISISGTNTFGANTGGSFNAQGAWFDTITVTGLNPGAPVQMRFIYGLDSAVGNTAGALAAATFSGNFGNTNFALENVLGTPPGPTAGEILVNTTVGAQLDIFLHLWIRATASAPNPLGGQGDFSVFAFVDAANTAAYHIEVLTPGADYSTDSGFRYDAGSAVPEPGTAGIVIAATMACAALSRHRRHR